MELDFVSLAVIVIMAFICPIISSIIPGKPISETVLLLVAGMVVGPNMLDWVRMDDALELLNSLGLGFLFLLAGYEIDPKILTGHQGRRGLVTWVITLLWAFLVVFLWPTFDAFSTEGIAVTIALTTTAIGTLLPILQERGILASDIGQSILSYGTWGELCPILAMTILLSTRAEWVTLLVLGIFLVIALLAAIVPKRARQAGNFVFRFIIENAETNAQMVVRATVLLMVGLTAISAFFQLDIVLGAFAAGFILRYVIPEGDDAMESKLHTMAFGFFIPLFFIYSGMKIDLSAVGQQPLLLLVFILLLMFVRALPIFVSLYIDKETRSMPVRSRYAVAIYCTTALPIIVAVTTVAVNAGAMSQSTASVLVAAGGITILIMPILGQLTLRTIDAEPFKAAKELREKVGSFSEIVHQHREMEASRHKAEVAESRHQWAAARLHRLEEARKEIFSALTGASSPDSLPPEQVTLVPLDSNTGAEETITIRPEPVTEERDALTAALDEQREIEEAEDALEVKEEMEEARKEVANLDGVPDDRETIDAAHRKSPEPESEGK